ncbi:MAG: Dam family site-specific DNA-(adenine-N6)-methyltransferase [Bacilli bacterium]|nr:Dam family site-specific DNA-(adenine-N6)-methyltransferase [Bacilli bacterium]
MNEYVKSPLNYTGGKHKLLPQLIPLFPDNIHTFVDLFAGGGNVVANVKSDIRCANDINDKVIEIFRYIQSYTYEDILGYIKSTIDAYELSMTNAEGYNKFRDYYNNCTKKHPLDLFILICYSFNHQIRFNSKGNFNMPFGKDRSQFNKNIEKNLKEFHKAISLDVIFSSKDFRKIDLLDHLKENDFVFCDPPYLITCASYNEQDGWNEKSEYELYELLDNLNKKGVKFGLTNVLENKGKTNEILQKWINDNPNYKVHHLNNSFNNCSYHGKNKESITDEVYVTNYMK